MDGAPLRVGVIDDDRVDRMAVRRALQAAGIAVDIVEIAAAGDAIAQIHAGVHFDLLFLDFHLPDGDGLRVLRETRGAGIRTPVIVLTGQASEETAVELMKAGATDYIIKDRLSADDLRHRVPSILRAHRAEEMLRRAQERLRLAVAAADIGIWDFNPVSGELIWDERCREVFGIGPDDPIDYETFLALLHPEDRDATDRAVQAALSPASSGEYDTEYRALHANGSSRWVRASGRAFFTNGTNGDRQPERFIGTVVDITARKRAEQELFEESRVIETLNRVGRRLTSETDPEEILRKATDRATTLTGADAGTFVAMDGELRRAAVRTGAEEPLFERIAPEDPLFGPTLAGERIVRHADLDGGASSFLGVPVASASGRLLGAFFFTAGQPGVFTDRHERLVAGIAGWMAIALDNARLVEAERRARQNAESAVNLRDEVLAIVSHDLRNPLNTVLSSVSLLTEFDLGEAQRERQLAIIGRATAQMNRLIQDLLDVARIDAGRLTVQPGPTDAEMLLRETATLFQPQAAGKNLAIEQVVEGDLPLIHGDRERLHQVLANLVANAIRHTETGSVRLLAAHAGESAVRFSVEDTGSGIAPADLPHLFDRFWQAARPDRGGAGLGLAIAKGIVDAHGGRIWAESEPGRGARFHFTIPVSPSNGA